MDNVTHYESHNWEKAGRSQFLEALKKYLEPPE